MFTCCPDFNFLSRFSEPKVLDTCQIINNEMWIPTYEEWGPGECWNQSEADHRHSTDSLMATYCACLFMSWLINRAVSNNIK